MHTILKDQIAISESIEVASGDLPCSYFHLRFFGRDFPHELRSSINGYVVRLKPLQEVSFLIEELRSVYRGLNLDFKSVRSHRV